MDMDLTITNWNEITEFLNGYVLDYISIENSYIYGINSKGEKILLAKPAGVYWAAVSGKAFEAVDNLIREVKFRVKDSGDFSASSKEKILKETFEEIIKLYSKPYNK